MYHHKKHFFLVLFFGLISGYSFSQNIEKSPLNEDSIIENEQYLFCELVVTQNMFGKEQSLKFEYGSVDDIWGKKMHQEFVKLSELNKQIISKELSQKEQDAAVDSFELAVQMEKQNLHRFEDDKKNLVGVDDFIETEIQDIQNSNRYITPNELKRYINGFLTSECPGAEIRGDSENSFITGSPALTEVLRNHTNTQPSEAFIDLMLKCETGSSFEVTFDSNESLKETQLFVHNRHLLVRCITAGYKEANRKLPKVGLIELESEKLHNTDWLLFVFHFETTGLYARRELFPVAVEKKKDGQVSTQLGKYALSELSTENPRSIQQNKLPSLQVEEVEVAWDSALSEAKGHRFSLDNELNERAETYINARVSSLEAGLSNRVERLRELSENPELNEKIRRMRQGQIINLTTTTKSKITELETLRDVTVSFKPVLAALLAVKE